MCLTKAFFPFWIFAVMGCTFPYFSQKVNWKDLQSIQLRDTKMICYMVTLRILYVSLLDSGSQWIRQSCDFPSKLFHLKLRRWCRGGGGGTTQPLPRGGGTEELRGDPTDGQHPKVWIKNRERGAKDRFTKGFRGRTVEEEMIEVLQGVSTGITSRILLPTDPVKI